MARKKRNRPVPYDNETAEIAESAAVPIVVAQLLKPLHARLALTVLTIATVLVYIQVRDHQFLSFDDNVYITTNPFVKLGLTEESRQWAWTTDAASNWHPLTWLSLMLDTDLFGIPQSGTDEMRPTPRGPHLVNLLLHIINTLLLYHMLRRMTGRIGAALMVAALFALHPLHVESVAWVTERKDVLSTLFGLLALTTWLRYVELKSWPWYIVTAVMLALSLMSKPMFVTFPCILLLFDFWPLGRYPFAAPDGNRKLLRLAKREELSRSIRFLILEKLPLFAVVAASSITTFLVQQKGGAVGTIAAYSLSVRVMNAVVAYGKYLWMTVWPVDLAFFYPHPGPDLPMWQVLAAALVLAVVTTVAVLAWRRHSYLLVGWLFYLGTLVPVVGLIQVGEQSMADRYTYVPLIGIFIIVAWGATALAPKLVMPRIVAALAVLLVLSVLTYQQVAVWKSDATLFGHGNRVTDGNYKAMSNLANTEKNRGDKLKKSQGDYMAAYQDALDLYEEALSCDPNMHLYHERYINLGIIYSRMENHEQAMAMYKKSVELKPTYAKAHNNIGSLYMLEHKDYPTAIEHFRKAAEAAENMGRAHSNWAAALIQLARTDKDPLPRYREALERLKAARKHMHPGAEQAVKNLELRVKTLEDAQP
jgi:hypothetical protein